MNRYCSTILSLALCLPMPAWSADSTLPPEARVPRFELVYECDVTLGETLDFGATLDGQRRIIPITGGSFQGPAIKGVVVPGGADWNLVRADGISTVEAAYYLRTDDGVYIRIVNIGSSAMPRPAGQPPATTGERFSMFTSPRFEAPKGKYEWLNRGTYVGTLGARADARNAVLIRVYKVI